MSRILLSGPDVRGAELAELVAAVESGWIAPVGPHLAAFESTLATLSGRRWGVGLSSGTAALHLALREAGVGPGDEVLVSTFTFAGSAFPVVHCGATPVFVDSEPTTWNLSPDLLAEELDDRRRRGVAMPKAVVVVDLYGQCADYDRIVPLLDEHGVTLLEDAAEAIGAWAPGERRAGSFGHAAVLSFNGNKLITTSGGGALVCDDEHLASRVRHLATQAREPVVHYEHAEIGFNYRLSNLLAAFGQGQLAALDERIARRRAIRDAYASLLAEVEGIALQPVAPGHRPNHWLTCITIDPAAGFGPRDLLEHLEGDDIESRPTWKPMHAQPVFADAPGRLDGTADRLFATGLCLPSGSGMSDADLDRVLDRISAFLAAR